MIGTKKSNMAGGIISVMFIAVVIFIVVSRSNKVLASEKKSGACGCGH